MGAAEKELLYTLNNTIKRVTEDMEVFSFNTAIARIMELVNAMYKYDGEEDKDYDLMKDCADKLVLLLAPLVPHIAEELGSVLGKPYPIYRRPFPKYEEKWLVKDEYELAVQVNSRIKAKIVVPVDADNKQIEDIAVGAVKDVIGTQKVVKVIVIPKRLVNIVVK